jgi:hypothetical protein
MRQRISVLSLMHAAEHLEPLLSEAVKSATAPHAFVDQLLEAEHLGREARRVRTARCAFPAFRAGSPWPTSTSRSSQRSSAQARR